MDLTRDFENKLETTYPSIERYGEAEFLGYSEWEWTEKIDGMNIQIEYHPEISDSLFTNDHPDYVSTDYARRVFKTASITIGGRTAAAQIPPGIVDYIKSKIDKSVLIDIFGNKKAIIFGEGYGEKIQSGGDYLLADDPFRQKFIVFDIAVKGHGELLYWLSRENVIGICDKLGLDVVPLFVENFPTEEGDNDSIYHYAYGNIYNMVKEGFKSKLGNRIKDAEGVVGRTKIPLFDAKHRRLITKLTTKYIRNPSLKKRRAS